MCHFYRYTYICLYIRYVLVFRFTHVDDLYLSVSDSADPTVGYREYYNTANTCTESRLFKRHGRV